MKTSIRITGQVASCHKLKSVLGRDSIGMERFFNDTVLFYQTKKEAVNEIKEAYDHLVNQEPEEKDESIMLHNDILSYDAAKAYIESI